MNTDAEFNELCQREIVKIRELTLKDDEYTGGLLGDAVGSPVGITLCVEARMKQVTEQQATIAALEAKLQAAEGLREARQLFEALKDQRQWTNSIRGSISNVAYNLNQSPDTKASSIIPSLDYVDNLCFKALSKLDVALAAYEQTAGGSKVKP